MADGFDMKELDNYTKKLMNIANETMPKESKKFIKKEAGKLNKKNKSVYKSKGIDKDTGNLEKSFKEGKAYKYDGAWSARAYNGSPHAHLLDKGWMWTPHEGQNGEEKFIPGFNFMEEAAKAFESGYYNDCEQFVYDLLDKGL